MEILLNSVDSKRIIRKYYELYAHKFNNSSEMDQFLKSRNLPKRTQEEKLFNSPLVTKKDFPGGSVVKNSPANAGDTGFNLWVGTIPWRRQWQPTPVSLPGEFWQKSLAGYSPQGRKTVGHDLVTKQQQQFITEMELLILNLLKKKSLDPDSFTGEPYQNNTNSTKSLP